MLRRENNYLAIITKVPDCGRGNCRQEDGSDYCGLHSEQLYGAYESRLYFVGGREGESENKNQIPCGVRSLPRLYQSVCGTCGS